MSSSLTFLVLTAVLALVATACAGDPDGAEPYSGAPAIEAELSHEGPIDVQLEVGQRVYLKARSIPIHPDYRDGKIVPEFDAAALKLVAEEKDTEGYGFTGLRYLFEAQASGDTEVRLCTYKGAALDEGRTSTYRLTVR